MTRCLTVNSIGDAFRPVGSVALRYKHTQLGWIIGRSICIRSFTVDANEIHASCERDSMVPVGREKSSTVKKKILKHVSICSPNLYFIGSIMASLSRCSGKNRSDFLHTPLKRRQRLFVQLLCCLRRNHITLQAPHQGVISRSCIRKHAVPVKFP